MKEKKLKEFPNCKKYLFDGKTKKEIYTFNLLKKDIYKETFLWLNREELKEIGIFDPFKRIISK